MTISPPGSQRGLRELNARRVLDAVAARGPLSQAEVARVTRLSPATVSNIVRELVRGRELTVTDGVSGGRRARLLTADGGGSPVVGIDFGREHLRLAVGDRGRRVRAERAVPLTLGHRPADSLALALDLLPGLFDDAGIAAGEVRAVGMGLPGPIAAGTRSVGPGTILPEWVGVDAGALVAARLGVPVLVDNDANLGALAEITWGPAIGARDLAYLKISTGIGCGLVMGGRVYRGAAGTAGEIGHCTIDEDGAVCRCGNRGCLETVASTPVVLRLLSAAYGPDLTIDDVLRMAADGDIGCRRVIEDVGRHLGTAVANLCNILNPPLVVLGGRLVEAGEVLLDPLRDAVRRRAIRSAAESMTIVASTLGARGQVLGALSLALTGISAFET
ncbi:ROK family transcriptional regulator [Pengzhenrongella frigida]|uniref:ROK family transcriptional regulator n=1 Tax=Pengzhenrongella frigida TaxID=1259133 RepID=A0A4Q5N5Z5_9MICO|nr:ROK family transcriptional regulator [Cellulomonas sp. HLT2-17]RYV52247.1 ROK family transcriptional regulator [Cellulomonas sp. HLT2-17]